ncbi:hypothetical protein [Dactylosporangium sp. CS-033363]|uniref:hypothetical protein n=1 Tax=Dactylosporangium sp. CS-033363 TaxID=3239935 RepID=UPI003D8DA6B5
MLAARLADTATCSHLGLPGVPEADMSAAMTAAWHLAEHAGALDHEQHGQPAAEEAAELLRLAARAAYCVALRPLITQLQQQPDRAAS